jgi:hypothetical protein
MDLPSMGSLPGMSALTQSTENQVLWGGSQAKVLYDTDNVIDSAAVDAGSTPTTVLRAGLILGRKTSGGLLVQYDPTATDGSEVPVGVLLNSISMLNAAGAVENKDVGAQGVAIVAPVKAANLTILGTAFTSSAYEYLTRQLLRGQFTFDDDPAGNKGRLDFARQVFKATDYTVVAADSGKMFIANAAVNFTLPTKALGLAFRFAQSADATMAILSASSSDDIVTDGDAGADSVTYSTSSHKIGSACEVRCVLTAAATLKWVLHNLGGTTQTIA